MNKHNDSRVCTENIPAFLLTRQWTDKDDGMLIELWLKSDSGPIYMEVRGQRAVLFVREADLSELGAYFSSRGVGIGDSQLRNFSGEPVRPIYSLSYRQSRTIADELRSQGYGVWEEDIRPADRFLMERFITSAISLQAANLQAQDGFHCVTSAKLAPSEYRPRFKCASIDIETNMKADELYSIGIYADDVRLVFMVGGENQSTDNLELKAVANELECLRAFFAWIKTYDPDILIGWSFVQFDLWVLEKLCRKNGIALSLGRGGHVPSWREDKDSGRRYINIPGRVALDGIEVLKAAAYNFDSFSLQNVSKTVLGEGKLLTSSDRGLEITELFEQDKLALAEYNLQDCALVWQIFEQLNLLEFCMERSRLTGLPLDRMGGSVAAFEFSYLPRLHRKGYVAPNLGELESDIQSPGGYVLDSSPGIYRNVLVLDFKSLYPSIIRTFRIDPYAFWYAQHHGLADEDCVPGFNGAYFARAEHLLPTIIEHLWQARDQAKKESNAALSQAIKIIMNSFYGVLGSLGCRFFDPRVCSSITLRGHEIIQVSKSWIEALGCEVIYGDTDSVFVWLGNEVDESEALKLGRDLAESLNKQWREHLRDTLAIECYLEIEFETHYLQFLMPTIRNSTAGSKKRYAGLVREGDELKLQFKGLENVRTDWTGLAKSFQRELYQRVFDDLPVEDYIRQIYQEVYDGIHDDDLVYRRRLRRKLSDYVKNVPPHVQAARKYCDWTGENIGRGDWIAYVITANGAEPVSARRTRIDYEHYTQKQLKPIADSVLQFKSMSFDTIVDRQMSLFS